MEIKEKKIQTEFIEKRGKVMNAEELRLKDDDLALEEATPFRDFGQIDFEDHEIEETIKRDNKKK